MIKLRRPRLKSNIPADDFPRTRAVARALAQDPRLPGPTRFRFAEIASRPTELNGAIALEVQSTWVSLP